MNSVSLGHLLVIVGSVFRNVLPPHLHPQNPESRGYRTFSVTSKWQTSDWHIVCYIRYVTYDRQHDLCWVRRHFGFNLNRYLVQLRTVTLSIWINQNLTYKIIDRKSDLNDRLDSDHFNIFYTAQMKIHEHSLCMITDPIVCQVMTDFIRRINKLYVIGKKIGYHLVTKSDIINKF